MIKRLDEPDQTPSKPTKRKVGRPTIATRETFDRAWDYLNKPQTGEAFPTIEGLALFLGVHRATLYEHEEFNDILEVLRQLQASDLLQGSAVGKFNPVIAKMILSSKHDYVERKQVEESGTKTVELKYTGMTDDELQRHIDELSGK